MFSRAPRDVPSADPPADTVDELRRLTATADRIVGFTGAGVSTESGIPDFRSPGGVWTRYDPRNFEFDAYLRDPAVRRDSWAMRREFFAAAAAPNPAHLAFAQWERQGRCPGVITQNIDGLHQLAGSTHVVEVHGSARRVHCVGLPTEHAPGTPNGCGWEAEHTWAFQRIDAGDLDPHCPECGAVVKSATISFGQVLDSAVIDAARGLARSADLLLVAGSSLQVFPAADLPLQAIEAGARLVILNDEPTDLDAHADLVVRGRAGEVLAAVADGAGAATQPSPRPASQTDTQTDAHDLPIGEYAFPGPLRDSLVAALADGSKTSTTSLLLEYEREGEPLPRVGDQELVVDSAQRPVLITEVEQVRILPLARVDLAHAVAEGEGYTSVAQWRTGHEQFWHSEQFRAEHADLGEDFTVTDATMAVCVRMRVVRHLRG